MVGLGWIEILIIAVVGTMLVGGIGAAAVLVGLAALPSRRT
jgi:hypothetical protein